jgi:hypothetical protein
MHHREKLQAVQTALLLLLMLLLVCHLCCCSGPAGLKMLHNKCKQDSIAEHLFRTTYYH